MSKKRKEEVEEEEVAPFWMISFSDLMTLLLSFFIILFSISTIEEKKMEELMEAMGGRYLRGGSAHSGNKDIHADPSQPKAKQPSVHQADSVEPPAPPPPADPAPPSSAVTLPPPIDPASPPAPSAAEPGGQPSQTPSHETQWNPSTDHTIIPFALDNTELEDDDKKELAALAEHLRGIPRTVMIRGHASHGESSRANVEDLAYERAYNVLAHLLSLGLERKQFSLVIVGANEPLKKDATVFMHHLGDVNTYVEIIP